jgi:hypothetical protein
MIRTYLDSVKRREAEIPNLDLLRIAVENNTSQVSQLVTTLRSPTVATLDLTPTSPQPMEVSIHTRPASDLPVNDAQGGARPYRPLWRNSLYSPLPPSHSRRLPTHPSGHNPHQLPSSLLPRIYALDVLSLVAPCACAKIIISSSIPPASRKRYNLPTYYATAARRTLSFTSKWKSSCINPEGLAAP